MINVINLKSRPDRLQQFVAQSREQGFEYQRWDGIETPQMPFLGIGAAHRQIVQDAKNKGLKSVVIAEDDCVFTEVGAWQYYLDNEPESVDLYLGMVYKSIVKDNRVIFGFSGLTLYTVYEKFYDEFLNMKPLNNFDRELGRFSYKFNYFVPPEFVCYQSNGYSDNRKKEESYDHLLDGIKLFGR